MGYGVCSKEYGFFHTPYSIILTPCLKPPPPLAHLLDESRETVERTEWDIHAVHEVDLRSPEARLEEGDAEEGVLGHAFGGDPPEIVDVIAASEGVRNRSPLQEVAGGDFRVLERTGAVMVARFAECMHVDGGGDHLSFEVRE